MMKFSIVITTYNRLSLFIRALDSALAQSDRCEVIVVDDCSSDGTEAYIRNLDQKVNYWRNLENLGHSASVNIGVKIAQGDWIKLLDDDDYLASNCIEVMKWAIEQHYEAVICSCQAAQVAIDGREKSRTSQPGPGRVFYIPQADIHYGMLLGEVPFGTTSQVAFRKDAFTKSGGWDVRLDVCDEIDAWIRIAQFGDAIFINSCLAYRLLWSGGLNQKHSIPERLKVNILMKEKIYDLVDEKHRAVIPAMQDIQNYLKLHWLFVAIKKKEISLPLCYITFPALLSLNAWKLVLFPRLFRYQRKFANQNIRKVILI